MFTLKPFLCGEGAIRFDLFLAESHFNLEGIEAKRVLVTIPGKSWCQDDSLVSGLLSYEVFRIRHIPIDPSLDPVKTVELETN